MMGSFLSRICLLVFGYAYPAYKCFKSVETRKQDNGHLQFWCQYWILAAALTVCEQFGDPFMSWLPFYGEAKLALFVYLWHPKTKGTGYVYKSIFQPYILKHESAIDTFLVNLQFTAAQATSMYWQRLATLGQKWLSAILQLASSQSASLPNLPHPDKITCLGLIGKPRVYPELLLSVIKSCLISSEEGHRKRVVSRGIKMQAGAVEGQVMDGSDIMELVENEEVFSNFVDHKFQELDKDGDGKLSLKELQPAVADIGAALGLPAEGSSKDSDHIYTEVLNEFTHGKHRKVTKTEFKKVLSDFLLGMATGLKRDPVVILRIDGEDLHEFLSGPGFEPELVSIFSHIQSSDKSIRDHILDALGRLTVAQGMPPCSDPMVRRTVVEPALQHCAGLDIQQPITQEMFLDQLKKVAEYIAQRLKEHPVIVAHSENTFNGSGIRRLLSNKFELDKALDLSLQTMPKGHRHAISKTYLRVALDTLAPSAGLPPIGAVDEIDKIIVDAMAMINADDGKSVKVDEFKKLLTEVLASIMLQLEGNPIAVSLNSVVHEPVASASPLLQLDPSP